MLSSYSLFELIEISLRIAVCFVACCTVWDFDDTISYVWYHNTDTLDLAPPVTCFDTSILMLSRVVIRQLNEHSAMIKDS